MAESNGESNSETQPPLCPCGFFGHTDTMGMCSKCYKDYRDKKAADASGVSSAPAASDSHATLSSNQLDPPLNCSTAAQTTSQPTTPKLVVPATESTSSMSNTHSEASSTSLGETTEKDGTSPACESPTSSAVKRSREPSETENSSGSESPAQKNRKRCFHCNIKLPPAIREIGRCRCDKVFCQLHRLPEQHSCDYDHKEKGRQEARDKMVPAKRHVGNALKRIDSDHQ